ncbi:MAG: hypothetical protein HQ517_02470, partial [SAR324 cluster bacterium]|nr:hypothetical protein [SAR324 cluster bacterium]
MYTKSFRLLLVVPMMWLLMPTMTGFSEKSSSPVARPLEHSKRFYFSPEGQFFIPEGIPLYLKVSTSPEDNAPSVFLKGRTSQVKKLNSTEEIRPTPFRFDTSGQHQIAVLSDSADRKKPSEDSNYYFSPNYQLKELFYLNLDKKPPTSTVIISPAPMIKQKQATVYGGPIQFRLKTADNESGLHGTFVSLNGAAFNPYQQPIIFAKEMDYNFRYYSVDNVGNMEKLNGIKFSIDLTPPTTNYQIQNDHSNDTLSPKTKLILKSVDKNAGVSKIYYGFDDNKLTAVKANELGKISTDRLKEGNHNFHYFSDDRVENRENKKTFRFYLDRTPPKLSLSIEGDKAEKQTKMYISERSNIQITAKDNKSGVKLIQYSFNSKNNWQVYKSPFPLSGKPGQHYLSYFGEDIVSNKTVVFTYPLYKDLKPPTTQYQLKGRQTLSQNRVFVSSKTDIRLKSFDSESGVQKTLFVVDNQKQQNYSKSIQLHGEGKHDISYYSVDRVNNMEKEKKAEFIVDNVPPTLFIQFSIGETGTKQDPGSDKILKVYPKSTMMFLGATDLSVGLDKIIYVINKLPVKSYDGTVIFTKPGEYKVEITAFDRLQNKKTEQ